MDSIHKRSVIWKFEKWSVVVERTVEPLVIYDAYNLNVVSKSCYSLEECMIVNVLFFIRDTVTYINTMRPRQNGRLFADDTFKRIFLNENIRISIKTSLFVPKGLVINIPALVLIMAWRRPGDKPLSEPMMVRLLTHICVTRPQWIKSAGTKSAFGIFRFNWITTRHWPLLLTWFNFNPIMDK